MIQPRHEWKHEISTSDLLVLRQRLRAVAQMDPHAVGGVYQIRSLYFDNPEDKALREKINGVNCREKFRLRYYNGDSSRIHLEKKSKVNGMCFKQRAELTQAEVQGILNGQLISSNNALTEELYRKMTTQRLLPKTIVDYIREPFVYPAGNVRITLDYNLRTSSDCTGFFDPDCVTIPAAYAPILLEVKWDTFLPSVIRDAIQLDGRRSTAFSKYAACRVYG
ncbi:MAG: polyphosphate polymerase domain-containing protein [Butyricicoccaceae bacterium]